MAWDVPKPARQTGIGEIISVAAHEPKIGIINNAFDAPAISQYKHIKYGCSTTNETSATFQNAFDEQATPP